jgi:excisionase family DNA binding protein
MTSAKLLTIKQAATALSLSPKTLWAWRSQRRIGIVLIGRSVRIAQTEIDRIVEEGTIPALEQK